MKTYYFYLDETRKEGMTEFYTVIRSAANTACLADEKAKQWAKLQGRKMAGGYWLNSLSPNRPARVCIVSDSARLPGIYRRNLGSLSPFNGPLSLPMGGGSLTLEQGE
jgi:hypothetical protein